MRLSHKEVKFIIVTLLVCWNPLDPLTNLRVGQGFLSAASRIAKSDDGADLQEIVSFLAQRDELPEQADLIMALGSDDMKAPMRAAQLYLQRKATKIVVSGGVGRLTYGLLEKFKQFLKIRGLKEVDWIRDEDYARDEKGNYILDPQGNKLIPEAKIFEKMLRAYGVPQDAILVEWKSQNTGQNIRFSKDLLIERGLVPGREIQEVILIQTPLLQARAALTFKKEVPNVKLINGPPDLPAIGAMGDEELQRNMELAVGEIYRIQKYSKSPSEGGPEDGPYIVPTEIPSDVLESSYRLAANLAIRFYEKAVYQNTMSVQTYPDPAGIEKIKRGFILQSDGSWVPKFFNGGGPLILIYLFREHKRLDHARKVFEEILREIASEVFPESQKKIKVHWVKPGADHIIASVVQEDVEVLDEDQQKQFVRVTKEEVQAVAEKIGRITQSQRAPILDSIGYAFGPDGGMIELFYNKNGEFLPLRNALTQGTNAVIGSKGVSRPKALIHMTIGRILEFPYSSDPQIAEQQREKVTQIIKKRAKELREKWGTESFQEEIVVDRITYGWDRQWNLTSFEPIASFPLITLEYLGRSDFHEERAGEDEPVQVVVEHML